MILSWVQNGGSAGVSNAAIVTNVQAQLIEIRVTGLPTITHNCAVIRIPGTVRVYATANACHACGTEVPKDELLIWNEAGPISGGRGKKTA